MRLKFLSAATVLLLTIHCAAAEQIGGEKTFLFVALGDQPYNLPDDGIKFDRLIAAVNKLKPAFTLHVGDIKSARIPCSNEIFNQALAQLQTFEGALVYTIGDNEWTDCHRKLAGGFDPRERLAKLRQVVFVDPAQSLGNVLIKVTSQAQAMPAFSTYVDDVRFAKNDVLFASVHVPGSNNGFEAQDPESAKEFFVRDKANVAWIAGVRAISSCPSGVERPTSRSGIAMRLSFAEQSEAGQSMSKSARGTKACYQLIDGRRPIAPEDSLRPSKHQPQPTWRHTMGFRTRRIPLKRGLNRYGTI